MGCLARGRSSARGTNGLTDAERCHPQVLLGQRGEYRPVLKPRVVFPQQTRGHELGGAASEVLLDLSP
jgi:hypothetical protein